MDPTFRTAKKRHKGGTRTLRKEAIMATSNEVYPYPLEIAGSNW
jgi:hypothetical protein